MKQNSRWNQFKRGDKMPAPKPRHKPTTKAEKRLEIRRADYSRMIAQPKIGDGHRGVEGYTRPGSNKK